jgi:hypothetical protein
MEELARQRSLSPESRRSGVDALWNEVKKREKTGESSVQ